MTGGCGSVCKLVHRKASLLSVWNFFILMNSICGKIKTAHVQLRSMFHPNFERKEWLDKWMDRWILKFLLDAYPLCTVVIRLAATGTRGALTEDITCERICIPLMVWYKLSKHISINRGHGT